MLGVDDRGQDDGMSRRDWVRLGLVAAGGAAAAATGITLLGPMLYQSPRPTEEFRNTIVYTRFPTYQWWNARADETIRLTDFQEWQGATGVWRARYQDGQRVEQTGQPVLVIRVKRDDSVFSAPAPGTVFLPEPYRLYYDDPTRDLRIVVLLDRSTHLCCYPGWHVVTDPPPGRDYIAASPTYQVYGLDPIYDVCHGGQWDPMALELAVNPRINETYVGARMVRGPGFGPLPVIPVRAIEDQLAGILAYPDWYTYCSP